MKQDPINRLVVHLLHSIRQLWRDAWSWKHEPAFPLVWRFVFGRRLRWTWLLWVLGGLLLMYGTRMMLLNLLPDPSPYEYSSNIVQYNLADLADRLRSGLIFNVLDYRILVPLLLAWRLRRFFGKTRSRDAVRSLPGGDIMFASCVVGILLLGACAFHITDWATRPFMTSIYLYSRGSDWNLPAWDWMFRSGCSLQYYRGKPEAACFTLDFIVFIEMLSQAVYLLRSLGLVSLWLALLLKFRKPWIPLLLIAAWAYPSSQLSWSLVAPEPSNIARLYYGTFDAPSCTEMIAHFWRSMARMYGAALLVAAVYIFVAAVSASSICRQLVKKFENGDG